MLRTRVLVGTPLVLALSGILVGDSYFLPHSPFLLAAILSLGWCGTRELWRMLPESDRPPAAVVGCCVPLILASNWLPHLLGESFASPWHPVLGAFVFASMATMLFEVLTYSADGKATKRIGMALLAFVYLGLLPSFIVQLRWLPNVSGPALAAAIFVPKVGDIFALLTGMAVGKHKFTPLLSPKKTWEGFAGGLIAAVGTAVAFRFAAPDLFRSNTLLAILFGTLVGLAGVCGDLVESLVKRDCLTKDSSATVPGFGGILDVIDSAIFAAPVAYLLLTV
jgi:phosphatidate cytidylyltransferase